MVTASDRFEIVVKRDFPLGLFCLKMPLRFVTNCHVDILEVGTERRHS